MLEKGMNGKCSHRAFILDQRPRDWGGQRVVKSKKRKKSDRSAFILPPTYQSSTPLTSFLSAYFLHPTTRASGFYNPGAALWLQSISLYWNQRYRLPYLMGESPSNIPLFSLLGGKLPVVLRARQTLSLTMWVDRTVPGIPSPKGGYRMLSGRVLLFSPQPCVIVGKSNGKEGGTSESTRASDSPIFRHKRFIALRRMPRKRAPHLCMRLVVIGPSCSLSESTGRISYLARCRSPPQHLVRTKIWIQVDPPELEPPNQPRTRRKQN